jgi:UPF0755 protein
MKRLLPVVLVAVLSISAILAGGWYHYQQFRQTPLQVGNTGLIILVEPGTNIRSVVAKLEQQGVTRLDWRWRLLSRLEPVIIKIGEYQLTPGMLPADLLELLASGKVVSHRFTIVEGWTVSQLLEALGRDPVLHHDITDMSSLKGLAGLPGDHPEGWFLPETYSFIRGDSDLEILRRAHRHMLESLETAWAGRDVGLPYETPYELLIMASIIEKETSLESERAEIAGVFVRRLLKNWRLETDPTVIYGMGDAYQGNIRRRDLKMDTPYNTYTRRGLPPTPIALPGVASLQAAAHPATTDAMFFVANGQGGHTFSSTLEEHNEAVRQLIKQSRDKPAADENK